MFTSFPHRKNLEQGYTNFIYKTFAFRIPWKKPQLFTGRIYAPRTEILFPTTNIKFLRLVVLAVGNKSSLFTERSKYINRLEELVFYSCVRNLIIQEYLVGSFLSAVSVTDPDLYCSRCLRTKEVKVPGPSSYRSQR